MVPRPTESKWVKVGTGHCFPLFFSENQYNSILEFLTLRISQKTHNKCQQNYVLSSRIILACQHCWVTLGLLEGLLRFPDNKWKMGKGKDKWPVSVWKYGQPLVIKDMQNTNTRDGILKLIILPNIKKIIMLNFDECMKRDSQIPKKNKITIFLETNLVIHINSFKNVHFLWPKSLTFRNVCWVNNQTRV